jgi:toxin ParE1/3/4
VSYEVRLTDHAAADLDELFAYIAQHDSRANAEYVLSHIEAALEKLVKQPHRGAYPAELSALGIREYREVFFKPYRIIYRVMSKIVFVHLIVDGRRDMQALLRRRLLAD